MPARGNIPSLSLAHGHIRKLCGLPGGISSSSNGALRRLAMIRCFSLHLVHSRMCTFRRRFTDEYNSRANRRTTCDMSSEGRNDHRWMSSVCFSYAARFAGLVPLHLHLRDAMASQMLCFSLLLSFPFLSIFCFFWIAFSALLVRIYSHHHSRTERGTRYQRQVVHS